MRRMGVALLTAVVVLLQMPGAVANHNGGFHWQTSKVPFTVQLINSTQDSKWADALTTRAKKWADGSSALKGINFTAGSTSTSTRYSCPKVDGKVRVCNYEYGTTGSNNFAGLTTWYPQTGHLQWVTVKLNDSLTSPAYRRAVICHELGHVLGLAHQSQDKEGTKTTPGTCLTPAVHTYQTLPDAHDFYVLDQKIYAHKHDAGLTDVTTADKTGVNTVDDKIGVHVFGPEKLLP
jgi:hypothetical protein